MKIMHSQKRTEKNEMNENKRTQVATQTRTI